MTKDYIAIYVLIMLLQFPFGLYEISHSYKDRGYRYYVLGATSIAIIIHMLLVTAIQI